MKFYSSPEWARAKKFSTAGIFVFETFTSDMTMEKMIEKGKILWGKTNKKES